jgi:hypothetical protein
MRADNKTRNGYGPDDTEKLITEVINALSDLPILARLEFAQNLLFSNGGNKEALRPNAELIIAFDVLGGVIDVLEKHPSPAQLRTPEHKLG